MAEHDADEEVANVTGRPASVIDLVTPPDNHQAEGEDGRETPEDQRGVRSPQFERTSGDPVSFISSLLIISRLSSY
jgi:hypothetical protein